MTNQIANKYNNSVEIIGTIIRKYKSEDGKWLVTAILTSSVNGIKDAPSIFWYGDMIDIVEKAYDIGSKVTISAYIQTRKQFKTSTIVGLDINETPHEIEQKFGVKTKKGKYMPDKNEILISGELVDKYIPNEDKKLAVITIKTIINGYLNFPRATLFDNQINYIKDCEIGDNIFIIGHIQTSMKKNKEDEKPTFYQSIVAHHVCNNPIHNISQNNT